MKASHELSANYHSVTPDSINAFQLVYPNSMKFTELSKDCQGAVLVLLGCYNKRSQTYKQWKQISSAWSAGSFLVTHFSLYLHLRGGLGGSVCLLHIKAVISFRKLHPHKSAAAKSLQLCLTLCDPIDGSPPGSAVPGILQARTLEWVAISFSKSITPQMPHLQIP